MRLEHQIQALKKEAFSFSSTMGGSSSSASFVVPPHSFLLTSSFTSISCPAFVLCGMERWGLQCETPWHPNSIHFIKGPLNAGPRPRILKRSWVTPTFCILHASGGRRHGQTMPW